MGAIKNWMIDIQEFCDEYSYGGKNDFTIDGVVEDVGKHFKTDMATKYARWYLLAHMGKQ